MEKLCCLSEIKQGDICVIDHIKGLEEAKHKRLIELGFVNGTKIQIIKNSKRAKLLMIGLRGFSMSLDYGLAEKIMVFGGSPCKK